MEPRKTEPHPRARRGARSDEAIGRALVPAGADRAFDIGFHQDLPRARTLTKIKAVARVYAFDGE